MTITDVQDVVIDPSGGYKFIVANVTDGNGGTKMVVRANQECRMHRYILAELERGLPDGFYADCIGGGRIQVDPEKKTIRIWGYSGDFGMEPDRQQTVRMLQAVLPEFQVTS